MNEGKERRLPQRGEYGRNGREPRQNESRALRLSRALHIAFAVTEGIPRLALHPMTPPYSPKRIALTGATGALGFAFLRHLFARQPEVRATLLLRRSSPSFEAAPFQTWLERHADRVKIIDSDIRELNRTQTDALVRTDGGLWHFAAVTAPNARDEDIAREINEVNVEGTRHLADACRNSGHKHSFFHVSTAYVHRTTGRGRFGRTSGRRASSSAIPTRPRSRPRRRSSSARLRRACRAPFSGPAW